MLRHLLGHQCQPLPTDGALVLLQHLDQGQPPLRVLLQHVEVVVGGGALAGLVADLVEDVGGEEGARGGPAALEEDDRVLDLVGRGQDVGDGVAGGTADAGGAGKGSRVKLISRRV